MKGIFTIFLSIILLFNPIVTFANIDNINIENEEEISESFVKVNSQIMKLDEKISKTKEELIKAKAIISETEKNIEKYETDIKVVENNIKEKQEILNMRVRAMYKVGNVGFLELLFASKDITDSILRFDMAKHIIENDTKLLETLQKDKEMLEKNRAKLIYKREFLEKIKKHLEEEEKQLNIAMKEKQSFIDELSKNIQIPLNSVGEIINKRMEKIGNFQTNSSFISGKILFPVSDSKRITSSYGYRVHPIDKTTKFHSGIDIGVEEGKDILTVQDGVVIYADWLGGYGKTVIISHGNNITTLYAHNSELLVKLGDKVKKGQVIAKSGNTGFSTGPHLHFEIRINNIPVNPILYYNIKKSRY